MGKVRGTSILGTIEYVRATWGADAVARVCDALTPETRAVLGDGGTSLIITTGWYEHAVLVELTREMDRVCGKGDLALARAAGRHIAFEDVNRFFRWLFKLTGPAMVFSRAPSVWNNYHDCGVYIFEGVKEGRASIRVEDWSSADPVMCRRVEGWMERALELTLGQGKRAVAYEGVHLHQDAAVSPHRFCRYVAEWDAR
jgi:hypothetical protein